MPIYRPVSVEDPSAQELLTEYFAMRAAGHPGAYVTNSPRPADFTPPAGVFLVVEDDEGPVGCGGIRMLAPDRAEVKHLYLRERSRGRGWGRELLAELEARAVGLGARVVVLDTNTTLEAAQGLYRSSGYDDVPPYNGNTNADLWLRKVLVSDEDSDLAV